MASPVIKIFYVIKPRSLVGVAAYFFCMKLRNAMISAEKAIIKDNAS